MRSPRRIMSLVLIAPLLSAVLIASSCSHMKVKEGDERIPSSSVLSNDLGSSDNGNALGLKTVHFSYDSHLLDAESKALLKEDAEILKINPQIRVEIEGHCDNRGGIQYNIALGEKRAKSVMHFLQESGVPGARLTTVSFGKERPLDPADTEEAYAKNRRANLAIARGLN